MVQPPGFVARFDREANFDGTFEFASGATGARLASDRGPDNGKCNFHVGSTTSAIYRINDNNGEDFKFQKVQNGLSWITPEADEISRQTYLRDNPAALRYRTVACDPTPVQDVPVKVRSLGVRMVTDVMTVALAVPPPAQIDLTPTRAEGKAAWNSLAYLLRRAAAFRLDVSPAELEAGFQFVSDGAVGIRPTGRVFLADVLENGAGYARHLSAPDEFLSLLRYITDDSNPRSFAAGLYSSAHASCRTSCYQCLREYGNMRIHALLDWRLGLDMAELLLDADAPIGLYGRRWSPLITPGFLESYFRGINLQPQLEDDLPVGTRDGLMGRRYCLILTHPLWSETPQHYNNELATISQNYAAQGYEVRTRSIFRVMRFPWEAA